MKRDLTRKDKIKDNPVYYQAYEYNYQARYRAKRDGLTFELTPEWFYTRLLGKCEVTGMSFYTSRDNLRPSEKHKLSPSVDRIDNKLGYTLNNSRLVIWWFNMAKSTMSDYDLWHWCELVLRSLNEKDVLNVQRQAETIPKTILQSMTMGTSGATHVSF